MPAPTMTVDEIEQGVAFIELKGIAVNESGEGGEVFDHGVSALGDLADITLDASPLEALRAQNRRCDGRRRELLEFAAPLALELHHPQGNGIP